MKTIDHINMLVDSLSAAGREERLRMCQSYYAAPIGTSDTGQKVFLDVARCTPRTWSLLVKGKDETAIEAMVSWPDEHILFGKIPQDSWAIRTDAENSLRQVLGGEFRA